MFRRLRQKSHQVDTLIGAGTRIIGDVQFTGGFHIDGVSRRSGPGDLVEKGHGLFLLGFVQSPSALCQPGAVRLWCGGRGLPRLSRRILPQGSLALPPSLLLHHLPFQLPSLRSHFKIRS